MFRAAVGLTPKQYARVMRFRRLLALLSAGPETGWAALAAELRLADQSHLIHEFHAFAGMTPSDFAQRYRGLDNYLPIGSEGSAASAE